MSAELEAELQKHHAFDKPVESASLNFFSSKGNFIHIRGKVIGDELKKRLTALLKDWDNDFQTS